MDTMAQSMPLTAEGTGQSGIGSYLNLGRGLQLQRAAFNNQVPHTGVMPQSPTTKVAGSKGLVSSAPQADFPLKPMAAMAGVAQQIGSGNRSTAPPLGRGTVLQNGPVRPSALSLAFSSFRMTR